MYPKIQFSIILFLLTLNACNRPLSKNDRLLENLSGNVMSINEVSYMAKQTSNGVIEGPRERYFSPKDDYDYFRKYNIEGNLEQQDRFFSDGILFEKIEYLYNDLGNKIEIKILERGRLPGFEKKIVFLYQNERLIEEIEYSATGDLIIKKNYQFDGKGNVIKEIRSYPNGRSNEIVFNYDSQGNQIEQKTFYPGGEISLPWLVFKYDNKGNKIEDIYLNRDKSSSRKDIYTYDDKNNIMEIKIFYDGHLEKKVNNTFQYDENGNWVKKVVFKNDIPQHIVKREIIYFK